MKKILSIGALFWVGCAVHVNRNMSAEMEKPSCDFKVYVDGETRAPADTSIAFAEPGAGMCYTEWGYVNLVQQYGCSHGYVKAALINVEKPGFMNGPCFRAKARFYKEDVNIKASATPVLDLDSLNKTGWAVDAFFGAGALIGGQQEDVRLISGANDTSTTSNVNLGLALSYHPFQNLALRAEGVWFETSADAPNTKSMPLISGMNLRLGAVLYPTEFREIRYAWRPFVELGLNRPLVNWSSDFQSFTLSDEGYLYDLEPGFGYYGGLGMELLNLNGLKMNLGLRYEQTKISVNAAPLNGEFLGFNFGFGYLF